MNKSNIHYQTEEISHYYSTHRTTWDQFYESERAVITRLKPDPSASVLDIGCGCGGLGMALRESFGVMDYSGVEINLTAAEAGRRLNPEAKIYHGDILELGSRELADKHYLIVVSLSCIDFNVLFTDMLSAAWERVAPGGFLVSTFRLTDGAGFNDITHSYQYINFEGKLEGERAPYIIHNAETLLRRMLAFDPSEIYSYGYWGAPSETAVTPCERICFAAFSLQKRKPGNTGPINLTFELPDEIRSVLNHTG